MAGQTIRLIGNSQRRFAHELIDKAPAGAIVNIKEAKRSNDQNSKLWAMLSDVSRAKPLGRKHTPEVWKCLFMQACGHETQFEIGIDGRPFPTGFSSSKMNVQQMADLITFIIQWGDEQGVIWSEPREKEAA